MKTIITISRQFGSGGRIIGKMIAQDLGIPFYDKEIINVAAEKSGLAGDFIQENEQKMKGLGSYAFGSTFYSGNLWSNIENIESRIYSFEAEAIYSLAKNGPCVIVGRCADYVLRGKYKCLNVFVHADMVHRKKRISEVYKIEDDPKKVEKMIRANDRLRAKHYAFYTDAVWGDSDNYHLCVDSGVFGLAGTAKIIENVYADFDKTE